MLVVGLTGNLATGKSTVAKMFAAYGAKVIDCDKSVHALLCKRGACYQPIVKMFGQQVVGKEGIDHKKLAEIVFNDNRQLKRLEAIIHSRVSTVIQSELAVYKKKGFQGIVVIEVPLLFESGFNKWMDTTIVVSSTKAKQIKRAVSRLKLTRTQALQRINAQMTLRDKIRLADIIINNNETKKETQKQVKLICQKLTQRTKK